MSRSLFARLAVTHLAVALASLVALGILLGSLLMYFTFSEKERTLIRYGHEIARLIDRLPQSPEEQAYATLQLEALGRLVGARIWLVAPDGSIVVDSVRERHEGPRYSELYLAPEEMRRVLEGDTIVWRGFFRGRFRAPVISVGVPLPEMEGERPAGAVFLHSPVVGVRATLAPINIRLGLSALAAAALALGLSLWLSRRLARPLHEMSEVAQELARGRFDRRVQVPPSDDEISRLAVSFNHMAAQLGNLERLRREFIANVSHELRSPLTSMRGFIQGILDGTVPAAEQEKYLRLAFDETRRLSRLVNDLLDLAALEAGDVRFSLDDVDPVELLRRAAAKMEPQAVEKKLGLTVDVPTPHPGPVRADPDRLEQVIINLLDNAIRFTPKGGSIILSVRQQERTMELAVRDNGPGIPPDDLDRIWERFYKVDRARTRSRGGTGLGLAIARELVERQGGSIRVESLVGEGTTFIVTLPVQPEPAEGGTPSLA